jgi:4-amino-4-deoxy-L-arabinose transferase-like glycosyltransferase
VRGEAAPSGCYDATVPDLERPGRPEPLVRFLRALLVLGSAWFGLAYLAVFLLRFRYPFELEWLEGLVLDHVRRVVSAEGIYVAPSLDFIPNMHTPLYYYVAAPLASLAGLGFAPLRLLSFAASVASLVLIGALVKRDTGAALPAIVAAGFFAGTFRASGAWFDLARVDSLSLAWCLGALYLLRFGTAVRSGVAAGALAALAFFTKQSALVVFLPVLGALLVRRRAQGLAFGGTLAVLVAAGTLALHRLLGPWYLYYTFVLPSRHPVDRSMVLHYWVQDLGPTTGIALALGLGVLWVRFRRAAMDRALFDAAAVAGMLGSAWAVRAHKGAWNNDLMPAHAILAVLFGLALHASHSTPAGGARWRRWVPAAVAGAALIQLALLGYAPWRLVPSAEDREVGQRLVAALAALPGNVLVPCHGYLAQLAGRPGSAHAMPLSDVVTHDPERGATLAEEVRSVLAQKRYDTIVEDDTGFFFDVFREAVAANYALTGELFQGRREDLFVPVTGFPTRPDLIFQRKPDPP